MNPTTSSIVLALETAWNAIQERYPTVQPCMFVTYSQNLKAGQVWITRGHYWVSRWNTADPETALKLIVDGKETTKTIVQPTVEKRDELYISTNILKEGAESVFSTLLHEAVHSSNNKQNIRDCSRGNRYHNKHFKTEAERMGLSCRPDPIIGWSNTELTPAALINFKDAIATLAATLHAWQEYNIEPGGTIAPKTPSRLLKAVCECGRIIRLSREVYQQAPITCALCDTPFHLD